MYNINSTETHNHQSSTSADARLSEKALLAIAWFEQFAKVASDNLPHLQQWSLPRAFNKKEVYNKYVTANGGPENSSSQLNYAWFLTLWRKRYPWIKIASVSTCFNCNISSCNSFYMHRLTEVLGDAVCVGS